MPVTIVGITIEYMRSILYGKIFKKGLDQSIFQKFCISNKGMELVTVRLNAVLQKITLGAPMTTLSTH